LQSHKSPQEILISDDEEMVVQLQDATELSDDQDSDESSGEQVTLQEAFALEGNNVPLKRCVSS
jgi:hypothetical protein